MSNKPSPRVEYVLEFYPPPGSHPPRRDDDSIQFRSDTPFQPIHVGDHVSPFTLQVGDEGPKILEAELGPLAAGASTIVVDRIERYIVYRRTENCYWDAVWIFTKRVSK